MGRLALVPKTIEEEVSQIFLEMLTYGLVFIGILCILWSFFEGRHSEEKYETKYYAGAIFTIPVSPKLRKYLVGAFFILLGLIAYVMCLGTDNYPPPRPRGGAFVPKLDSN